MKLRVIGRDVRQGLLGVDGCSRGGNEDGGRGGRSEEKEMRLIQNIINNNPYLIIYNKGCINLAILIYYNEIIRNKIIK